MRLTIPAGHRFQMESEDLIRDRATGLIWTRDAGLFEFPLGWQEGLAAVAEMNRQRRFGRNDWRLPNRNELRSLLDHAEKRPALPPGHPFRNLFLGWYWTSTTAAIAPAYAWYIHLEGARMFYGNKRDFFWLWPVCGDSDTVVRTGQTQCFDEQGDPIDCAATGQDGELQRGRPWPEPRFRRQRTGVLDELTGLRWQQQAALDCAPCDWAMARAVVAELAERTGQPWRLPTIRELESLVDASQHSPALPAAHPFTDVRDTYWSATTSGFDGDWAFALYLTKGAVGVGHKQTKGFSVWPVKSE